MRSRLGYRMYLGFYILMQPCTWLLGFYDTLHLYQDPSILYGEFYTKYFHGCHYSRAAIEEDLEFANVR